MASTEARMQMQADMDEQRAAVKKAQAALAAEMTPVEELATERAGWRVQTSPELSKAYRRAVQDDIDNRFSFHPVKPGQPDLYGDIRGYAKNYAEFIVDNVPPGVEREAALVKLEEAVFWANAAVARA